MEIVFFFGDNNAFLNNLEANILVLSALKLIKPIPVTHLLPAEKLAVQLCQYLRAKLVSYAKRDRQPGIVPKDLTCRLVNKPFKLRSLFMNEILHVESLQLLLEKFGDYLENFGFEYMSNEYNEPKRQLFKSIMEYCTKIRYFDSGQEYIMKKERVKYLAINSDDDDYELFSLKDEAVFSCKNFICKNAC
ncbi:hypothetical protein RhiirA1_400856 [Rhizophagus irregularis]|uniref:Uncharacterized protein n=1 Tax=Rhizophagus irregularis TaxID=588596 RepID=A0A2N0R4B5_9GLOM|nr:hypothetical protein RhiirA1_400856 [Rhizophagus irregularis]